ncbi:unnamed protein product, partial [Laminaria digitata]
ISLQVSTVDGFQGREVDVVIFSCVRGASGGIRNSGGIGFLTDNRRMNVAITRARRSLIILGHGRCLSSDSMWRALFSHAKINGCLIPEIDGGSRGSGASGGSASGSGASGSRGEVVGEGICNRVEAMAAAASGLKKPPADSREITVRGVDSTEGKRAKDPSRGVDRNQTTRNRSGRASDDSRGNTRSRSRDNNNNTENCGSAARDKVAPNRRQGAFLSSEESAASHRRSGEETTRVEERKSRADSDASRAKANLERTPRNSSAAAVSTPGEDKTNRATKRAAPPPVRRSKSPPTSTAAGAAAAAAAAVKDSVVTGREGERGGDKRPEKRARMAVPQSQDGAAVRESTHDAKPGHRPVDIARKKPPPESDGGSFLGGLLGSLSSNAGGIASGKEYDFRQGLRGGEDEERKRAAAAPRLDGARITDLGRPLEPKQALPVAFPINPPPRPSARSADPGRRKQDSAGGREDARRSEGSGRSNGVAHRGGSGSSSSSRVGSGRGGSSSSSSRVGSGSGGSSRVGSAGSSGSTVGSAGSSGSRVGSSSGGSSSSSSRVGSGSAGSSGNYGGGGSGGS